MFIKVLQMLKIQIFKNLKALTTTCIQIVIGKGFKIFIILCEILTNFITTFTNLDIKTNMNFIFIIPFNKMEFELRVLKFNINIFNLSINFLNCSWLVCINVDWAMNSHLNIFIWIIHNVLNKSKEFQTILNCVKFNIIKYSW